MRKVSQKKGITAQIVNVFILVLIISVLSGMTFLFTAQMKTQVLAQASAGSATNLAGGINSTAYQAVNSTEAAGANVITYLGLVFLALIFGAILLLVLKIMVPYINLGQQMGSGF